MAADQDLAILGLGTQPRGEVAHRADRGVARAFGKADLAQGRVALRDASAETKFAAMATPSSNQLARLFAHRHRPRRRSASRRRLDTLAGKTVGFISNGKEGTKGFFAHLERILRDEFAAADVVTRVKSNFSAPADPHIVSEIGSWDAVVTGIGD